MRPLPDNWSIVIVGRWNVSIFHPAWLTKHLFEVPDVQIEFSTTPGMAPRFTGGDVRLIPQNGSLALIPVTPVLASMEHVEHVACKVLELLVHTPVTAVGVNFGFEEPEAELSLLEKFPDPNSASLAERGLTIQHRASVWQVMKAGQMINISAVLKGGGVTVDFNFHSDVHDAKEAQNAIQGRILEHVRTATAILEGTFGLTQGEQ